MRQIVLAALAALVFAQAESVSAQAVPGREFAAAINDVAHDVKAEGLIFVPEGVTRIAAVVVVVDYGTLAAQLYADDELRKVVRDNSSAAAFVRLTTIRPALPDQPVSSQLLRNAAAGGGDALDALMRRLSEESRHSELRAAPMVFWGFSAAASFGTTFAASHPDRTLAFVRYHTHRRGLSQDPQPLRQIPALLIAGGRDETAGVEDAESFWRLGRSVEAPWAYAIEPDSPHSSSEIHAVTARTLTIPWIAGVLQHRLPPSGGVRSVLNGQAWLADKATVTTYQAYAGNRQTASWLPDERSARGLLAISNPVARVNPLAPISGAWTGTLVAGTNRIPMSIEMKFDGKSVANASVNVGGIVGDTQTVRFDATTGRFVIELDARPATNPRALVSHWVIEGVEFEGTATGHAEASNDTTALTGHFLITRNR